jgi:pre-mRNA-processing factor SLU7
MSRQSQPPKPSDAQPNSRNEYIPSFISKAPFYATGTDEDYLEHQRLQSLPTDTLDKAKWYSRGLKTAPAATKFRKGACENCGALTHKTKECLSRPRKAGAKWTGKDIQADEVVSDVKLGWDAKRDRWNGYDAAEYSAVVAEYQELEAAKKAVKASNDPPAEADSPTEDSTSTPNPDDSETRYAEETDMGRNQPTSTRQLRLREDTAKYLLDLNLDSQRYDPKTRSMDAAPSNTGNADDGFVRPTLEGDAADFERAQRYAWETQEGGGGSGSSASTANTNAKKLHLQANPTEGEVLLKKQSKEAEEKRAARAAYLASTYGNTALLPSPSTKSLLAASSSQYIEYDPTTGTPKSSLPKAIANPTSKYSEDIHPGNHTSIFGSWWTNFQWGYACCHSLVRNSYCTGEEGRRAFEQAENLRVGELLLENGKGEGETEELQRNTEERQQQRRRQDMEDQDEGKAEAISSNTTTRSEDTAKGTRKRTLKELRDGITEEEMEGYKKSRVDASDPMTNMLGKDELAD